MTTRVASKITLTFQSTHTAGILAGLVTPGTISFPSKASADEWLRGVKKHAKRNGYTVGAVMWG